MAGQGGASGPSVKRHLRSAELAQQLHAEGWSLVGKAWTLRPILRLSFGEAPPHCASPASDATGQGHQGLVSPDLWTF